jgi:hypothetical protein
MLPRDRRAAVVIAVIWVMVVIASGVWLWSFIHRVGDA